MSSSNLNNPGNPGNPGPNSPYPNNSNFPASRFLSSKNQPGGPAPSSAETNQAAQVRIRASLRRSGSLLLDLPIAGRLTLGFLIAAMIAILAAGLIGALRAQSLSRQSAFYQNLLQSNTSLNTGANFLQLMNTEGNAALTVAVQQTSQETLTNDTNAMRDLSNQYNQMLNDYLANSLVEKHPDEVAVLTEANHSDQVAQQRTLAASTLRTWKLYQAAQNQILQYINNHKYDDAEALLRVQAEPTNADAQSALRSLIQLDQRLAQSNRDAASVEEQQQIITTIAGSILAFLLIALVGWLISGTLVKRLKQLRRVTRLVENGQLDARVTVIGRDEIADVSASINAMLDAIVGLVEETRQQRDALTNAAEHLFTDMRVVSAGDLRINASVGNDPIGMLANAFNFTVGRFRRFVLRTQMAVEQIEVIMRQELERATSFSVVLTSSPNFPGVQNTMPTGTGTRLYPENSELGASSAFQDKNLSQNIQNTNIQNINIQNIQEARERLQKLNDSNGFTRHIRAISGLTEQISQTVNKLLKTMPAPSSLTTRTPGGNLAQFHAQELRTLETTLLRLTQDLQNIQRNTTNDLFELDTSLAQLSNSVQTLKAAPSEHAAAAASRTKDAMQELTRQGQSFTNDIVVLTRNMTTLTQEMRAAVVSFQLDTGDPGLAIDPGNNPAAFPSTSSVQNNFADSNSRTLPPLRDNFSSERSTLR
jgi:methyl-accepting chemotaxis protein